MNSYVTPSSEPRQISNAELSHFQDLITAHGPYQSSARFFGQEIQDESLMKDRALRYYVDGPVYRGDNSLLARAWITGYVAAFHKQNPETPLTISFEIDNLVSS